MISTPLRSLVLATVAGLSVTAVAAHEYHARTLTITHPWSRETAAGQDVGGGFMVVVNAGGTPDRLLGGSTPAARSIEVHEMSMDGGVMRMRQVTNGLAVPAHGTLELKPGSYHLMLMGLKAPLKKGTRVPAPLRFAHAGAVKVEFQVEAIDFAGPHAAGGHDGH